MRNFLFSQSLFSRYKSLEDSPEEREGLIAAIHETVDKRRQNVLDLYNIDEDAHPDIKFHLTCQDNVAAGGFPNLFGNFQ